MSSAKKYLMANSQKQISTFFLFYIVNNRFSFSLNRDLSYIDIVEYCLGQNKSAI